MAPDHPSIHQHPHLNISLCSSGPYYNYIASLSALTPGVATTDPKNKSIPLQSRDATVTLLNLQEGAKPHCRPFRNANELQEHFDERMRAASHSGGPPERRIYILEGLNTHYISVIGGFFYMDPEFFADQEQTSIWDRRHNGARMTEVLPSLANLKSNFCLPYFEIMYFEELDNFEVNCAATGRHVGVTRIQGKFEQVVFVRRKFSFWSCKNDDGGWDVVILTDPQVRGVVQNHKYHPIDMPNAPFQGGYIDFIPRVSHMSPPTTVPSGPSRVSMRLDLIYYWCTHYSLFPSLSSPTTATMFPRKIIASHYMQLLHSIRSIISSQEWHLSRKNDMSKIEVNYVEEQWSDLQALNRRCTEYCEDIERIMVALGIKAENANLSHDGDWMSSEKDFQFIYAKLKALKTRCEVLLGSITGLAGIAGNRQSLKEAKNVKILTFIGMLFIPLAFICALFSMNDTFLPGSSEFWVYWATAVPLVIVVFLMFIVVDHYYVDLAGTGRLLSNLWRFEQ